ncbi:hypothetical protein AK830_g5790 [Neonectria ditissima]|uniref:Uncharacterized protein n=1 Tax=Neonectria ditissima TaxID=78410 RepID=A0A0P7ASL2_9HYPO|nr:hypothetical protein AK830_g5790 [Neonectria ditissima]
MEAAPSLSQSCKSGDVDRVEAILKEQAARQGTDDDWQKELDDCLYDAIASSRRLVVGALLAHGAKLTDGSFAVLLNRQDIGVFEELVNHGFDVNTRDYMGQPPLRQVFHGFHAQPDLANDRGVTPLGTCAIHKVSPEMEQTIDLLLASGADISKEKRILHVAIRPTAYGGVAMLKLLLSRGADPSYQDPDTGTPLHYAASLGLAEEARVLAETEGVDLGAVVDGCTAADVARSRGHDEVAAMLEKLAKGEKN